jgi:hypothetical protein
VTIDSVTGGVSCLQLPEPPLPASQRGRYIYTSLAMTGKTLTALARMDGRVVAMTWSYNRVASSGAPGGPKS